MAFDALLEDCLYVKLKCLPEDIRRLIHEFVQVGFFQISKLSSSLRPEQVVCFLHKSIQEYIVACYIVQELTNMKRESPTCLPKVDSFDKVKKMVEVLKFACELSPQAARGVLSHLRIVGEKEGLTECRLSETPHVEDLSKDQRLFRSISLDCVLSCPASDREALCPLYFHAVNNVLVLDTNSQLSVVARDHVLKFSVLPESCYIFTKTCFQEHMRTILNDLETVLITCYRDTIGAPTVRYSALVNRNWFLKKEGQQTILYFSDIKGEVEDFYLLRVLTSAPESPPEKRVDHLPLNQADNSGALHSTENTSVVTLKHSLSFVRNIKLCCTTTEELRTTYNVSRFLKSPRIIEIMGFSDHELIQSMTARIPFTNNLYESKLHSIDLSADFAKSLYQAPNLRVLHLSNIRLHNGWKNLAENLPRLKQLTNPKLKNVGLECEEGQLLATVISHLCQLRELDLSFNPLGRSVIGLAKHLPSLPHLTELLLVCTLMGKEEVIALARSLPSISKLKKLNLSGNPLGQGVIELAQYLTSLPHLTELGLDNTHMGAEEVRAVARTLKYVCELRILHLSGNPLDRGVSELTQHLSSVPKLHCLNLCGVTMTKKEASELCTAVQRIDIILSTDYTKQAPVYDMPHCPWEFFYVCVLLTEAELEKRGKAYADSDIDGSDGNDNEEAGGGDLTIAGSPGRSS